MATVRERVGEEKSDLTFHHSLVPCWCLPLTKPNQKPEFKGPLKRVPYISASWAPSRVEKDGERSGGKLTMSSTQGYVTFIIAGKVIRNKSPLLCSVLSHLHTLPFLLPAQRLWILHNHGSFRPPQCPMLPNGFIFHP